MVHAHFENAEAALTRHPGEAQWHADMIIVALDGAVHCVRRIAVERMKERFLGAGLSNRARYANDSGGCASDRFRAQGIESGRSEERRVGKEGVSQRSYRGSPGR